MALFLARIVSLILVANRVAEAEDEAIRNFNRNKVGVELHPFVKTEEMDHVPSISSYSNLNVKTILKVISTRFSRVLTSSVDASDVPYQKGGTYYHYTSVKARVAEMAAQINRERGNLSITVLIGIYDRDWTNSQETNTELQVALEAHEIAHSIYPGTVEGLYLFNHDTSSLKWANETLRFLKLLRNMPLNYLRIGTRQYCDFALSKKNRNSSTRELFSQKEEIIRNSDFVICSLIAADNVRRYGPTYSLNSIRSDVLRNRFDINSINKNIEVMWHTDWQRQGVNETKRDVDDMRHYWYAIDSFATEHNYTVWLKSSFDNRKAMGWWKLSHFNLINNVSGYVEKVSGFRISEKIENVSDRSTLMTSTDAVTDNRLPGQNTNTDTTESRNTSEPHVSKIGSEINKENLTKTASTEANHFWIYGGLAIGAIGALLLALFVYIISRNKCSSKLSVLTRQEIEEFRMGFMKTDAMRATESDYIVNNDALTKPYDIKLEISKGRVEILTNQILGGGEFGCVFKAILKDDTGSSIEVALKTSKPNCGATALKGLLSEIKILSYVGKHPNIISIVGAVTTEIKNGTVYVVLELCPLGSLKRYLKQCEDANKQLDSSGVPMNDMVRWSYEIACGMEYLEGKGVIHADLAARNVLLSSESTAKIADFGLSRRLYEYVNYTKTQQEPLPWRWMVVESLKMSEFSTKSDVWGYGVTLWEIFSLGSQPYPGLTWTVEFVETLEDGFRLKKPRHATPEIFEIMASCWSLDKNVRPSFTDLKHSTCNIKTVMNDESYTTLNECFPLKEE